MAPRSGSVIRAWQPRGLRAPDAALYLGIGQTKFHMLVKDKRLPAPRQLDGCTIWDRFELDAAFDEFAQTPSSSVGNTWDD